MTAPASTVVCPNCGRRNRVPAAAKGLPRCGQCHNPLPWLAEAGDDSFADVVERSRLRAPEALVRLVPPAVELALGTKDTVCRS
jgi:ribosomal protein L37AE/L43A